MNVYVVLEENVKGQLPPQIGVVFKTLEGAKAYIEKEGVIHRSAVVWHDYSDNYNPLDATVGWWEYKVLCLPLKD